MRGFVRSARNRFAPYIKHLTKQRDIYRTGGHFDIDKEFDSFGAWMRWHSLNAGHLTHAKAKLIADNIRANGFIEPLTGLKISPKDITIQIDNLREGILARGINSRMRAVLALIDEKLASRSCRDVAIYGAEAVTGFALLMRGIFPKFIGSEYWTSENARHNFFPIQHQDLTALTFPSNSFDLVTTNEVLEHVPDLDKALSEIARILKPGGWHIGTHPFRFMHDSSDLRAKVDGGKIIHIKQPEYHGNPIDPVGGSLVFEIPGWDIISRARTAGFRNSHMRFVASEKYGFVTEHVGVFVFCAQK